MNSGPEPSHLAGLRFSVRAAVQSPFCQILSADPQIVSKEIQSKKSVTVLCLMCGPSVPPQVKQVKVSCLNNSNFYKHVKKYHQEADLKKLDEWLEARRTDFKFRNPTQSGVTRTRHSASSLQSRFDDEITNFIMHSMVPLRVVEDESFRKLLSFLSIERLGVKVMSRRTLGRRIDGMHARSLERLRELMGQSTWVATTADIWSGGKRSFLGMTAHWIDVSYRRKSAALACRRFSGDHTFDRIAELVQSIHESLDLPLCKIVATVTDNASNFVKAFQKFGVNADNIVINDSEANEEEPLGDEAEPRRRDDEEEQDAEEDDEEDNEEDDEENNEEDDEEDNEEDDEENNEKDDEEDNEEDDEENAEEDDEEDDGENAEEDDGENAEEDDGENAEEDDGENAEEDDGENAEEDDGENAEEDDGENHHWIAIGDDDALQLPRHLRCAAHTLSLCASTDLQKVLNTNPALNALHRAVLEKCNVLWNMSQRPKTAEIIKKITGKCLQRPGATRWNSLYDSLTQLVELRGHMSTLRAQLRFRTFLDTEDFSYLTEYLRCAKPLADALNILQGEQTAFYGVLLPTLIAVKRQLLKLSGSTLMSCRPMVDGYLRSLETRFCLEFDCHTLTGEKAAIAAISLPRFKKTWFTCIPAADQRHLLCRFLDILCEQQTLERSPVEEPMQVDDTGDFYDFGEESSTNTSSRRDTNRTVELMMLQYLDSKEKKPEMLRDFPLIEKVFREYNTQPASSAQVERLFSYATLTNAPVCNRLSDEKFEQRVLLRINGGLQFP